MTIHLEMSGIEAGWQPGVSFVRSGQLSFGLGGIFLPVVGRSGSGKSTLLFVLSALKKPLGGTLSWSLPAVGSLSWGKEGPKTSDEKQLRRSFGFAFQESVLVPQLSVEENLEYPLVQCGLPRIERIERIGEILSGFGLSRYRARYPHELSVGERHRVSLAQAVIAEPAVLFADEPGGNLDQRTRREIFDYIERWVYSGGNSRAFVVVTHNYDDAFLKQCSHFLLLDSFTGQVRLLGRAEFDEYRRRENGH